MIRHILPIALLAACTAVLPASARAPKAPKQSKAQLERQRAIMTDSLRIITLRLASTVDSLRHRLEIAEAAQEEAESVPVTITMVDPQQAATDSVASLRQRLQRKQNILDVRHQRLDGH